MFAVIIIIDSLQASLLTIIQRCSVIGPESTISPQSNISCIVTLDNTILTLAITVFIEYSIVTLF